MTRRTFWLALLVAASQVSAGCCCWRQHCAGWRLRHWHGAGGCCPAYSSPVSTGPACTSCAGGGAMVGGPVVAYGGPVVVPPGGPIPLHAPTPVVTVPAPLGGGPLVTPVPNPMPPVKPGS